MVTSDLLAQHPHLRRRIDRYPDLPAPGADNRNPYIVADED